MIEIFDSACVLAIYGFLPGSVAGMLVIKKIFL